MFRTDAVSFLSKNKSIKLIWFFYDPPYDFQDYNKIIEYGIAMETLFIPNIPESMLLKGF